MERNATYELQKTTAINIFAIAVMNGDVIISACHTTSKFTGFSDEVIHRWSRLIFLNILEEPIIENVDDVALTDALESQKG